MQDQSSKTTPIAARVFDAAPPMSVAAALGPALLVSGVLLNLASIDRIGAPLVLAGVAAMLVYGLRPRRKPRETRVFCNVGGVAIEGVGVVRARDIDGATTARFGDRVSLMLAHKKRKSPIILELADEASLLAICKSLGVGHHGFGSVDMPVKASGANTLGHWTYAATLASMAGAIGTCNDSDGVGGLSVTLALTAGVLAFASFVTPQAKLRMTSTGVYLPTRDGMAFAPFDAIEDIRLLPRAIAFQVRMTPTKSVVWHVDAPRSRFRRQGATQAELEHAVAQIQAAVDRAHGKFVPKAEPENALAKLRRAQDEPIRAWLARLDTLSAGAAGYRAMSIEQPELWAVLEDPEADADSRAAAARVLARSAPDELKVRIANVLATERDERARVRIAASLGDEDAIEREVREETKAAKAAKD